MAAVGGGVGCARHYQSAALNRLSQSCRASVHCSVDIRCLSSERDTVSVSAYEPAPDPHHHPLDGQERQEDPMEAITNRG